MITFAHHWCCRPFQNSCKKKEQTNEQSRENQWGAGPRGWYKGGACVKTRGTYICTSKAIKHTCINNITVCLLYNPGIHCFFRFQRGNASKKCAMLNITMANEYMLTSCNYVCILGQLEDLLFSSHKTPTISLSFSRSFLVADTRVTDMSVGNFHLNDQDFPYLVAFRTDQMSKMYDVEHCENVG